MSFYSKEALLDSSSAVGLRVRVFDAADVAVPGETAGGSRLSLIFSVGVPGAEYASLHLSEAGLEAIVSVASAALVQRRVRREAYEEMMAARFDAVPWRRMELRRPDGTVLYRQHSDLPISGWPGGIVGAVEEWHDGELFARGDGDGDTIRWALATETEVSR